MNVDDIFQGFENPNDVLRPGFAGEEEIRKPDAVKKQRLMDVQNDYFEFQAKKDAMANSLPVRYCNLQHLSAVRQFCLFP